ncbi:MAG: heat-inducible transcription repressor HrcA, partial [Anaerolineales bacterium]|nr:heat-inducible transcription repressor HrcA [Anaerolineales bacterium]
GQPVGSKTLVARYKLNVSSATVRNEMSALDALGFLVQLHTSAGRIPTERGYRYFVQRLLGEYELPARERQMIQHQFHQARLDLDQWMRLSSAILARTSLGASVVTAPRPRYSRFKHLQLISTQGRLVLMVLVLYGGEVKQQMLTLADSLPQTRLTAAAERLNAQFDGLGLSEIETSSPRLELALEREVALLVLDAMRRADERAISNVYRAGLTNIMEDESTRPALRVLEERTRLASVLSNVLDEMDDDSGVRVVIGGDGRWEELKNCSIILSRYGVGDELMGEVAVIGPTRMSYGRNISAVRYVAGLMSSFVSDYYVDQQLSSASGGLIIDAEERFPQANDDGGSNLPTIVIGTDEDYE